MQSPELDKSLEVYSEAQDLWGEPTSGDADAAKSAAAVAGQPDAKVATDEWRSWNVKQVTSWLASVGLQRHVAIFSEMETEGDDLDIITNLELEQDFDIEDPNERKLIMDAIQQLTGRAPSREETSSKPEALSSSSSTKVPSSSSSLGEEKISEQEVGGEALWMRALVQAEALIAENEAVEIKNGEVTSALKTLWLESYQPFVAREMFVDKYSLVLAQHGLHSLATIRDCPKITREAVLKKGVPTLVLDKLAMQARQTDVNELGPNSYVETVYEQQKLVPGVEPVCWKQAAPNFTQDMDAPAESKPVDKQQISKNLPHGWIWADDWVQFVDRKSTDEEGWSYVSLLNSTAYTFPIMTPETKFRRRQWVRVRVKQAAETVSVASPVIARGTTEELLGHAPTDGFPHSASRLARVAHVEVHTPTPVLDKLSKGLGWIGSKATQSFAKVKGRSASASGKKDSPDMLEGDHGIPVGYTDVTALQPPSLLPPTGSPSQKTREANDFGDHNDLLHIPSSAASSRAASVNSTPQKSPKAAGSAKGSPQPAQGSPQQAKGSPQQAKGSPQQAKASPQKATKGGGDPQKGGSSRGSPAKGRRGSGKDDELPPMEEIVPDGQLL